MSVAPVKFDSMVEVWQERYREARGGDTDAPDVRKTEDFIQKKDASNAVFKKLKPLGESFLSLVKGLSPGSTDSERAVREALCFFPKFMQIQSIADLPDKKAKRVSHVIDETYFLGLASHLILYNNHYRHFIPGLNTNNLYQKFLEVSGVADAKMSPYNKDLHGMPEDIFREQFTGQVEPLMQEEFSIGFLKMGKVRSHFRNLFFAGIILGVLADTQASEY